MSRALAGVVLGGMLSWSAHASAEDAFPGALQEAAQMECIPSCLMCHTNNPGTKGTWSSKAFPAALVGYGKIRVAAKDVAGLKSAYALYAADPMHADEVALIKRGIDPATMENVCTPSYGCGARFAPKRAAESGALLAMLALGIGLLARRHRR